MKNNLFSLVVYFFVFTLHVHAQTYPADLDHEFDSGSGIKFDTEISQEKINRLTTLCKVWGFVKYYHPTVANGNYNMDYELFRLIPKIMDAEEKSEYIKELSDWVKNLGEVNEKEEFPDHLEIKLKPEFKWMTAELLGNTLKKQLEDIKTSKRPDTHYYRDSTEYYGYIAVKNELPYENFIYPDDGFRLLTLFRYWNIIEYYFPYKYLIDEDWNDVLKEFIPRFILAQDEREYKYNVMALMAKINDSHAFVINYDATIRSLLGGKNIMPVEVKFIEGKAVVTNYLTKNIYNIELEIGDIIESIDGVSVEEIVKEKLPTTAASNYSTQLRNIASYLLTTDDTKMTVTYNRNGISHTTSLLRDRFLTYPEHEAYKRVTPDISYLYPGTTDWDMIPEIMEDVMNTKGFIIDLRCYPKESFMYYICSFLMPEPQPFVKFTTYDHHNPGVFYFDDEYYTSFSPNPDYYKGKVVILINEETQSHAEFSTMAYRMAPDAVVIGSTTAGADGNIFCFFLPGNIYVSITGLGVYNPDYSETQRVGIIPDIYLEPTIKGIRSKEDELLNKAIRIINGETSIHSPVTEQEYNVRMIDGKITITRNTDNKENYQIRIFSIDGRLILSDTFKEQEKQYQLEKNNTAYLIQIENRQSVKTHKILY